MTAEAIFDFARDVNTVLLWLACEETSCSCRCVWETIVGIVRQVVGPLLNAVFMRFKASFPIWWFLQQFDTFEALDSLLTRLTTTHQCGFLTKSMTHRMFFFFFRFPPTAVNCKCSDLFWFDHIHLAIFSQSPRKEQFAEKHPRWMKSRRETSTKTFLEHCLNAKLVTAPNNSLGLLPASEGFYIPDAFATMSFAIFFASRHLYFTNSK